MLFLTIASSAANADSVDAMNKLPNGPANNHYVNQRSPLTPSPLQKLPTGVIKAEGWLKVQLDLQKKGFAGRLPEISRFLDIKNNAWLGNGTHDRAGWEETPYWLKGQVSLAYVTGDPKLIAEVKKWIEPVFKSQAEDGWFGPVSNRETKFGTPDLWPNMLMQSVLQTFYEATGDQRVIDLMTKYVGYLDSLPKEKLFDKRHYWHWLRVGDQLASLVWLYNRTGDQRIPALAERIHTSGANWAGGIANRHGVNFAQGFREPATFSLFSNKKLDWSSTEEDLKTFRDTWGQSPGGMYAADENARTGKTDPRQATESCSVVEMMYSHEMLFQFSGDPIWGDKCEDVAFNWLPATMTPDLKALRYLTAPNTAISDGGSKSPGVENGGPMFLMDPNDHRCCQHNVGMGWPYFTEYLWFATNGNGLLAAIYSPCKVTAKVGDEAKVTIEERTNFPFDEKVEFRFSPSKQVRFPFAMRIPHWCANARVAINGRTQNLKPKPGQFVRIDRTWKKGDVVTLTLPMKIETKTWSQRPGAISVYRGPLAYSLKIDEEYRKILRANGWHAYEILPKSDWNFGLAKNASFKSEISNLKSGIQLWTPQNVPVKLITTGRQIPEWTLDAYRLTAPLQKMPAKTSEPEQKITLIPMGAARLRITVFPTVSTDAKATPWKKPRQARKPVPTTYSHRNWWDSEAALSDGLLPASSSDEDTPRFTWWDHKGTEEWVQYTFPQARAFQSARVYWYDDTGKGGCRLPESWKIQEKVNGQWQDVHVQGEYPLTKDNWCDVSFDPVVCSEIRLVVKLKPGFSGGLLEWELH